MRIFCGIDGTSNLDVTPSHISCFNYDLSSQSPSRFIKRISGFGFEKFLYFPGTPHVFYDTKSKDIVAQALRWILFNVEKSKKSPAKIYLAGFSRGGAAAIVICHKLKELNIPVSGLYLFDAVDRFSSLSDQRCRIVPSNVLTAFHAIRCRSSRSRLSFGNCGLSAEDMPTYKPVPFKTTHGGVGGWLNGENRVMSGTGSEDYLNLIATNTARLTFGPAAGLLAGAALSNIIRDDGVIHEKGEPLPTTLSPEQEAKGSAQVWKYMYECIQYSFTAHSMKTLNVNQSFRHPNHKAAHKAFRGYQ